MVMASVWHGVFFYLKMCWSRKNNDITKYLIMAIHIHSPLLFSFIITTGMEQTQREEVVYSNLLHLLGQIIILEIWETTFIQI